MCVSTARWSPVVVVVVNREMSVREERFTGPEGLFDIRLWEMDHPSLPTLVFKAIQSCPMDSRRHMYRLLLLTM